MSGNIKNGFTIVELLIVIVVIAILAAIAIIAYSGIREQTIDSSMKSDLRNGGTALELEKAANGAYPWSTTVLNSGSGLVGSGSNQITYLGGTNSYCLLVTNPSLQASYHIDSVDNQISPGSCGVFSTTIAGAPSSGFNDATGLAARFYLPTDAVVDSNGAIFVADSANNRIRRISPSGVVTTFAGSGTAASVDGTGTAAQLHDPTGLAIDVSNTLYVTEGNGHKIRKITAAGVVTTLAGSVQGNQDGTGTAARFNRPSDITVSSTGDLFVNDYNNDIIRRVTQAGVVTTFAGSGTAGGANGTGTAAQFNGPWGMAIDTSNNLYVVEDSGHRLRRITPGAVVTTLAGSGVSGTQNGNGTAAQFSWPQGVAISPNGDLYVADSNNGVIRRVTQAGVVTTFAGTIGANQGDTDGPASAIQFRYPWNLTVDSSGTLYVADTWGHRIRKIIQ